jgi:hypothetical protein
MQRSLFAATLAGAFLLATPAFGPNLEAAAKATTVRCKDGTTSAAKGRGACSGHGGVVTKSASKDDVKRTKTSAAREKKAESRAARKSERGEPKAVGTTGKRETDSRSWFDKLIPGRSAAETTPKRAARPGNAPATATAQCNDGAYSYASGHRGACSGHGGVRVWFK